MADDTTSDGSAFGAFGAWLGAEAGKVIDANIDRNTKQPQIITSGQTSYGIDANGHVFPLGQPAAVQGAPLSKSAMIMIGVGAVLLVVVLVVAKR